MRFDTFFGIEGACVAVVAQILPSLASIFKETRQHTIIVLRQLHLIS